jgi:hypothetical protein
MLDAYDVMDEAADELEKLHDLLGKANALARIRWGEIERLKAERDTALSISEQHSDVVNNTIVQLAECQAREAKHREALEWCGKYEEDDHPANQVLALPIDDTALQEAIKQGQREILLKAADFLFSDGQHNHWAVKELRRMVKELK